jgi:proprotein convertase subtilisin/kexin type 5
VRQCTTTLPFYYGSSCLASCIDGTYLMSDLVTCNNCSLVCATCSLTASNCTRCVGAFLYNYNCVSQCPNNFYANSNLTCEPCTSTVP